MNLSKLNEFRDYISSSYTNNDEIDRQIDNIDTAIFYLIKSLQRHNINKENISDFGGVPRDAFDTWQMNNEQSAIN